MAIDCLTMTWGFALDVLAIGLLAKLGHAPWAVSAENWFTHSAAWLYSVMSILRHFHFLKQHGVAAAHLINSTALRLHRMSWGVKTTCFKAPGVSLGGSGVSIGGVRSLREQYFRTFFRECVLVTVNSSLIHHRVHSLHSAIFVLNVPIYTLRKVPGFLHMYFLDSFFCSFVPTYIHPVLPSLGPSFIHASYNII